MKINDLVKHKKLKSIGIGCISKILKSHVMVNFGVDDCIKCKPSMLELVDTSKCKTLSFDKLKRMLPEQKDKLNNLIIGNEVKQWVGFGWVSLGVVIEEDFEKYKRVVE